jgi:hypothetical protein
MSYFYVPWLPVESRGMLLSNSEATNIVGQIKTSDENSWGYFRVQHDKNFVVGYANLGLSPVAAVVGNYFIVGINEMLAGYNVNGFSPVFVYRMPCVFHEFVSIGDPLIVRDELGFVCISLNGIEQWKYFVNGPINKFEINKTAICGTTIDGEQFSFSFLS